MRLGFVQTIVVRNFSTLLTSSKSPLIIKDESSGSHGDAGHGMNFIPLTVKSILDISADDADMRADGRQGDVVCEALTCGLSVRLSYWEPADNFEDEVASFIVDVS